MPWDTDIFENFFLFAKFFKYSRPYFHSFWQIFPALCLFTALHLFRTLEYIFIIIMQSTCRFFTVEHFWPFFGMLTTLWLLGQIWIRFWLKTPYFQRNFQMKTLSQKLVSREILASPLIKVLILTIFFRLTYLRPPIYATLWL